MIEKLPATLSPFATNHPASSAYRITLSAHEWTWTQAEQEAMARALVRMDAERSTLRERLQQMLCVAENCDETGYADGVGFIEVEKLHAEVRAALNS